MKDYKAFIKEAFAEVLANPEFNEETIARYFGPSYQQHVDGKILNYDQFVSHMKLMKQKTTALLFDFRTVVQEGNIVFTNHIVSGTKSDGTTAEAHLIAEFHIENDQIVYCSELSRLISGTEEDRDLGSAH
jgi:hypothetical protein